MAWLWTYTCVFVLISAVSDGKLQPIDVDSLPEPASYISVQKLNEKEFESFKNQQGVHVVYFFQQSKDSARQATFLKQYAKSAKVLSSYKVGVGLVECENHPVEDFCTKRKRPEDYVFSFRDGYELLSLTLENMFDVDSIVSNILQIVLLRDVPIIQSKEERAEHENRHKGTHDLIFSYQVAIGTLAHRILMEAAFAYSRKYKFALTTEQPTVKELPDYEEKDESALWLLKCKDAKEPMACQAYKYKADMKLTDVARFLRVLDIPLVHDVAVDGAFNPFHQNDLHSLYIYYDNLSSDQVKEYTQDLQEKYMGLLGFLLINVDLVKGPSFGLPDDTKVPTMAVFLIGDKDLTFMDLEQPDPYGFVHKQLSRKIKSLGIVAAATHMERDIREEDLPLVDLERRPVNEIISEEMSDVETEDDQVAAAVYKLKNKKMDMSHAPLLTDKTFPNVTADSNLIFVLFYLKFDAPSMAFLRHYVDASLHLANLSLSSESQSISPSPLARVNCYDWTDVCGKQNVTTYPSVRIYRKGRETVTYRGMLSAAGVVSAVQLFQADDPHIVSSPEQGTDFLNRKIPTVIAKYANSSILGLFNTNSKESLAFKEAAEVLHGRYLFGMATGSTAKTLASKHQREVPCIVIQKHDDKYESVVVYQEEDITATSIVHFVQERTLSVFPELSAMNFPGYLKQRKPFVLFFHERRDTPDHEALGKMAAQREGAAQGHKDSVIFAHMFVDGRESLNYKILASYNPAVPLPCLVMVLQERGAAYMYEMVSGTIEPEPVSQWIDDVIENKLQPTKMLNDREWKPLNPGFDFLKIIKDDKERMAGKNAQSNERMKRIEVANELGMARNAKKELLRYRRKKGFNEDGTQSINMDRTINPGEIVADASDSDEMLEDSDIREELLELRNSRLFQHQEKHQHTEL